MEEHLNKARDILARLVSLREACLPMARRGIRERLRKDPSYEIGSDEIESESDDRMAEIINGIKMTKDSIIDLIREMRWDESRPLLAPTPSILEAPSFAQHILDDIKRLRLSVRREAYIDTVQSNIEAAVEHLQSAREEKNESKRDALLARVQIHIMEARDFENADDDPIFAAEYRMADVVDAFRKGRGSRRGRGEA